MDLVKGGILRLPRRVFSLHNDLHNSIKGGGDLGEEDEGLDVVHDWVGRILHPGKQAFYVLDGWFRVP